MIRRPPRSTQSRSSAASDVYKRQANFRLIYSIVTRGAVRSRSRISRSVSSSVMACRSSLNECLVAVDSPVAVHTLRVKPHGLERRLGVANCGGESRLGLEPPDPVLSGADYGLSERDTVRKRVIAERRGRNQSLGMLVGVAPPVSYTHLT